MLTLAIFIVCAVISTIVIAKYLEQSAGFVSILLSIPFSVPCTFLIVMAILNVSPITKEYVKIEEVPIYALQNKIGVQGSFFLGCGRVRDEIKIFYITKKEFGYMIESISANDVYLNEKDCEPRIEKYAETFKNDFLQANFYLPVRFLKTKTIVNIPPNSIKYNFNIDLSN